MKIIEYTNRFNLKFADVWFCENVKDIKNDYDILNLKGYKNEIKDGKNTLQHSLMIDLMQDEDTIFNGIKKNVKYEINRCYKENVSSFIYNSEDLKSNREELLKFEEMYNQMYKEKNMNVKLALSIVDKYIESNSFLLTKSVSETGKDLVYHAYVVDKHDSRLWYSCSNFRSDDNEEKKLIARANKYLHWEDIKYFKNNGFKNYDFGGISSFENPNGIDQFKMAFGGNRIDYYNISLTNSLKGKIYKILKH